MSEQAMTDQQRGRRKTKSGIVVSDKMDKTVVVEMSRLFMHLMYKKYVKKRVKYKVHDELNTAKVGDTVTIEECRPLSREKRWRITEITHRAN